MTDSADLLRYRQPKRLKLAVVILLCLALLIVVFGMISRVSASRQLVAATDAAAVPTVAIITPGNGATGNALVLPGDIKAFDEAPIYAQVSGYLKQWYVDIGAPVQAGQLMAEIDTPDLDQQLVQAKANLATALANQQLSASTARRWNALLAKDAVSQQDADEKNGDLAAKTALVAAARADVERLQALEGFKRIVAPFDGVVTSRSTDIGALISVGGSGQSPLFTVDDVARLRIYVAVPQIYSAEIKPGMNARFTVPEYPGQSFPAALASTANAITTGTGTLLVQFQVDNSAHLLQPGDYAQVHIALAPNDSAITVPSSALMFRDAGMEVATLGPDGHVLIKPVTIGRDLGTVVEIAYGLSRTDRIIDNPPDSLHNGDAVQVAGGSSHATP
jgi:RND family efflux transporter MFP subunit